MSNTILLVFEGEKTEKRIFDQLEKHFFGQDQSVRIRTAYKMDIYDLWREASTDPFLDVVELLREKNPDALAGIERDAVDQIYLFFDYDGHDPHASDEKLAQMLDLFSEETDNGKLYVSYPMVEAYKDDDDTTPFLDKVVPAKQNIRYKKQVAASTRFKDPQKITFTDWLRIIELNLQKANLKLVDNLSENGVPAQPEIFGGQLQKYITPNDQVAVLSALPFFIKEYFGENFEACYG